MSKKQTLHIISIALGVVAIGMVIVGIKMNLLAPGMTGIGFLLITSALRALR
jgi:Na+-transporting NADH:ubiquinone oxidoreductase subunit NqrB